MDRLGAEVLLPGHGVPIWGTAAVHRALDETATLLEDLTGQVIALLNQGATLDEILARAKVKPELLERPYLSPIYDAPEFIVRNLCRLYGGWWDGNPAHLQPPREAALAGEVAALAGGAEALAYRARELANLGNHALACELIELAVKADPEDRRVHGIRAAIYDERAKAEKSLMARGVYTTAADDSRRNS